MDIALHTRGHNTFMADSFFARVTGNVTHRFKLDRNHWNESFMESKSGDLMSIETIWHPYQDDNMVDTAWFQFLVLNIYYK